MVKYHGILGPAAKWRDSVVPGSAGTTEVLTSASSSNPSPFSNSVAANDLNSETNAVSLSQCHSRNYVWSELMKRVFAADS